MLKFECKRVPIAVSVAVVSIAVASYWWRDGPPNYPVVNPPLNSAIAAHGGGTEGLNLLNALSYEEVDLFLFGETNAIQTTIANHCPDTWTRTHIHTGLENTDLYYYDASRSNGAGQDADSTNGIDRAMLFFYAGHGDPESWDTLGNKASSKHMLLGNDPASLRYYWQHSCEVFAHGPRNCPEGGTKYDYSCPGSFDGSSTSSDSYDMRNVYERWGPALAPALRMACGHSTKGYGFFGLGEPSNSIWDYYLNHDYDVSNAFIHGSRQEEPSVVSVCLTTGACDTTTSTPLHDDMFTNLPNPSGNCYHLQYPEDLFQSAQIAIRPPVPEKLPYLELIPIPLPPAPDPWGEHELIEKGDFMVSQEVTGQRGATWRVHRASGAMYVRGPRFLDTRAKILTDNEYLQAAEKIVQEMGWTERLRSELQGTRSIIETRPRDDGGSQVKRSQKDVTVRVLRRVEVNGLKIPVFGAGGTITIQLNNDGSLFNAAKVWRPIREFTTMVDTKPYIQAEEEAKQVLGDAAGRYNLDNWTWGYKEEAGNVEQRQMAMFYRFYFHPMTDEDSRQLPPRLVEIEGMSPAIPTQ